MPATSENPFGRFERKFFDSDDDFMLIGDGALGGKAQGLAFIRSALARSFDAGRFPDFQVNIPRLAVITTDHFDRFMTRNGLYDRVQDGDPDDRIAHAFQTAELPVEIAGDLRALVRNVHTPLAVRSSSLLEDALLHPFAGVYATKMIPNNQHDADVRFRKLAEAIKFVYASTFFRAAQDYRHAIGRGGEQEKMAVVIQEVVGQRRGDRFYPNVSGVARSFNFYPTGHGRAEDGIVNLALGLGKTIVDGGVVWSYSPAYPAAMPPFGSVSDLLKHTQTQFWAVNMGKPPAYDPIAETEYLTQSSIADAETDGVLDYVASTYRADSDRLTIGIGAEGPRVLTFAPILDLPDIPLNDLIRALLETAEEATGAKVEIEFAVNLDPRHGLPARLGFLQIRPMLVSDEMVEVSEEDLTADGVLVASDSVMGNGVVDTIQDVVYVRPDTFEARHTPTIAAALEPVNRGLINEGRPYLLIGFGRWGSTDPWLGVPVNWSQISGAKAIVEAATPEMDVEPSQGSHFFHNITSLRVSYFSVHHSAPYNIDWQWLAGQELVTETNLIRHVRLRGPLIVRVDGRNGRGLIRPSAAR